MHPAREAGPQPCGGSVAEVATGRDPWRARVGSTAEQGPGRWEEHIAGRPGASEEEEQESGRICAGGRWCEHGNGKTRLASLGFYCWS